jgi:hypothetical protein
MSNFNSIFVASSKTAKTSDYTLTRTYGEGKGAPKITMKIGATPATLSINAVIEAAKKGGVIVTFSGNLRDGLAQMCKQAQSGLDTVPLIRALYTGDDVTVEATETADMAA